MNIFRLTGLLFALPLIASGANSARQELATVLAAKPDATRGAELFEACASCHGVDGGGATEGTVPRIAGQHFRVLAEQIVDFRHGKRWDFRMEGVASSHQTLPKLQDITDVAWYASQLERGGARGIGDGTQLEAGAALYAKHCASCHGGQAEGNDKRAIPRLAGQHAGYLSRQVYDAVDGRRPRLARSHGKAFAPLAFEEVRGLSDYLARIGWNSPQAAPGSNQ
jgi:cytochrome c553